MADTIGNSIPQAIQIFGRAPNGVLQAVNTDGSGNINITGGTAGSVAFSGITSGTNTAAAMVLGAGSSLTSVPAISASAFSSTTANPAVTGVIELARADTINWRNNANNADVAGVGLDTSNRTVLSVNGFTSSGANWAVNANGQATLYRGETLVGSGLANILATTDLSGQTAAKGATTLLATTLNKTGVFQILYVASVTTAASVSSVLGGTLGFQVRFTDANDTVVKTFAGAAITSNANTTGTTISGCQNVYAANATNIQYLFDYTSSGTAMAYDLSVRVVYIGP